jgi:hypothetical protein
VGFGREPALTHHGRDRLCEDHWQPFKLGSKTDKNLRLFWLKNRDFQVILARRRDKDERKEDI